MHRNTPLKIAVTGPESSGKTTLAQALAAAFDTVYTPESARTYLEETGGHYTFEDLTAIAKGQLAWEDRDTGVANGFHFCDTDLIVLKVWSTFRFGKTDPFLLEQLAQKRYDVALLCRPDIPWVFDPLRENPEDRTQLLSLYRAELTNWKIPFIEIHGPDFTDRLHQARTHLELLELNGRD